MPADFAGFSKLNNSSGVGGPDVLGQATTTKSNTNNNMNDMICFHLLRMMLIYSFFTFGSDH
jgi:hypothetical protein